MISNLDAIYENGAFHPVGGTAVTLTNGAMVRLTVEPIAQGTEEDVLELASKVYAGLSKDTIDEIEAIATDRSQFFSR
jgi:predicted DNA-binding antitoxin AbrB/MazE fold protein